MKRIGIVGTGYIASGVFEQIRSLGEFEVTRMLTRRPIDSSIGLPPEVLTNSVNDLIDHCDVVVEASGDAMHATEVLLEVSRAGKPIITSDPEFQVTTGSYFVDKGYLSDADGDQPGCLARLKREVEGLDFKPLAYVNIKGFLNENPPEDEMRYWAERQKLSLEQTISFTDGSKLQIEQALVANGLGAAIARDGMIGQRVDSLADVGFLGDEAKRIGRPISDYVLWGSGPPGVFIVAEHDLAHRRQGNVALNKLLTSDGKYFRLLLPYHLIFLEVIRTLRDWAAGEPPMLNNGTTPEIGVCAVAKRDIASGDLIERGLGSFDCRGVAVRIEDHPDHVPICLLENARLRRKLEAGQTIGFDDVDLPDHAAVDIYQEIRARTLRSAKEAGSVASGAVPVRRRLFQPDGKRGAPQIPIDETEPVHPAPGRH